MEFFTSLLGAGANLLGGLLGKSSSDKALAAQQAMNNQNIALQKEFAQTGLQWRAADARAAERNYGINPLALLGSPTSSFSNVVGSFPGDNSLGAGVAAAGQDVARGAQALADSQSRKAVLSEKLLEAQIANVNSDTVRNQAAASQMVTRSPRTPGVNVVMPRSDPRPPKMFTSVTGDSGETIRLVKPEYATSLQLTGATPLNAGIGMRYIADAFKNVFGGPAVRGDVWRDANPPDYYGVP